MCVSHFFFSFLFFRIFFHLKDSHVESFARLEKKERENDDLEILSVEISINFELELSRTYMNEY